MPSLCFEGSVRLGNKLKGSSSERDAHGESSVPTPVGTHSDVFPFTEVAIDLERDSKEQSPQQQNLDVLVVRTDSTV